MANFSAADVKKLREATGAGMMDCKKALEEADGNHDKAIEVLRIKGMKSVSKREGRSATNGLIAVHTEAGLGVMIELNCETDFVAKGDKFIALRDDVLKIAVDCGAASADELMAATTVDGKAVSALLDEANAQIGEKIVIGRVGRLEAPVVESYLHRTNPDLPAQIGVLVGSENEDTETARGIAMHAAAMAPKYLHRDEVDAAAVDKERELIEQNAREEGKPEQAIAKIVEGRLRNFFAEVVLLDQAYAKEPKKTIEQVADEAGLKLTGFTRFRVGNA